MFGVLLCCVTTRRLGSGTARILGRRELPFLLQAGMGRLAFAPLSLRFGMLSASFRVRSASLLPLGCLPAMQCVQTFAL